MRLTVPAKLTLIAATTMLAFIVVLGAGVITSTRQREDLSELEGRLVPKLALGPRLEAEVARLQRSLQDAVAAQDTDALNDVAALKARLINNIDAAGDALDSNDATALKLAVDEYYAVGRDVSQRLIAGETGERLVEAVAVMQGKQERLASLLERAIHFDQRALSKSFAAVRAASDDARSVNALVGVCALALVALLSVWANRSVLDSVRAMSNGLARFATGDFTKPIAVLTRDELGRIAVEANKMAESLQNHAEERARADWLRMGQSELADELRGELDPQQAARRAISFLVRWIGGAVGAVYLSEGASLRLVGHHGLSISEGGELPKMIVREGDGLLGQAALVDRVVVVDDPPENYLKVSSALGSAAPRALVFVPLVRQAQAIGVIEIALFQPCSERTLELLSSVREQLAVTLEAARSQASLKTLLAETQTQAERLARQEEELRHNNSELRAQQDELQRANEELESQRAALREHNAALDAANREVRTKADEVAKVSSYKSQFLANMSHELRTPLNSMLLLSHLMSENESKNLTPKQVEYSQTIHAAGKDLMSLINQVLDLAKIESGKQDVHVETIPLSVFADQARRLFGPVAAEKRLTFEVHIASDLPSTIATDQKRLEQILINLLGNALKFTSQGSVALRIRRPDPALTFNRADLTASNCVAFEVSDTGIGIAPAAQEAVFLPFEQIDASAGRQYGGTGLGLAIAKESAALLGGELHLSSTVGSGSTFTCLLPFQHSAHAQAREPRKVVHAASNSVIGNGNGNGNANGHTLKPRPARESSTDLLIIEDDTDFADQLADIARARHLNVIIADTAAEGLRLARERQPQGIVLDVKLPDDDGWSVMERLRHDPLTRDIPVHFVSGFDARERGVAMGAVGYLVKPTTRDDLRGVVNSLISSAREQPRRILVVEDNSIAAQSIVQLLGNDQLDTLHAPTAAAALRALTTEQFGCMLLDLGLPDMDGLQFLASLRTRTDIHTPPVIVYTGRELTRDEVRHLEAYAQAVVLKDGYSEQRLLDEIHLFVEHLRGTAAPPTPARSGIASAADSALSLKGAKLLVVDDDMRTLYALAALLRSKGAEVFAADNGRFALEVLSDNPNVDAVLMDIMMPEMDGYETMRQIRAQPPFAALPIVALTAKAMRGERERCIEAGATDYQPKPVDGPLLINALHGWLQKSGATL